MAKLIYSTITSLDGYVADDQGNFDWGEPDEEVFVFVNDLERRCGTTLYGRRMYETMVYWETIDVSGDVPEFIKDFTSVWRAQEKVVYSTTLESVSSARTRLERTFDADTVRRMKVTSEHDISIGGANLAGQAIMAGLVDELHLFVTPVTVGGGTPAHPTHRLTNLELLDVHHFGGGTVHLKYRYIH